MKPCCHCKVVKSLSEFSLDKRKPDGRQNRCKQCRRTVESAQRKPLIGFANGLRSGYGMSVDDFLGILAAQGGQCAICRCRLMRPVIDHDHTTGRVRGLVCFRCNSWLAAIENVAFSKAAHRYLREHAMLPPTYEFYKNPRHFEQLRRNKAQRDTKRKAQPRLPAIQERMQHLIQ